MPKSEDDARLKTLESFMNAALTYCGQAADSRVYKPEQWFNRHSEPYQLFVNMREAYQKYMIEVAKAAP